MKKLLTGLLVVALFGAVAAVTPAISGDTGRVAAQEEGQEAAQVEQAQDEGVIYHYVAQPGDSYTLMARKAVQTYGKKHDVNLSLAGIIYAETNLTQEAGSPYLVVGQEVEVAESAVKQWVEKAQELSVEELAEWEHYAAIANFNTDHVGEAQ